MRKLNLFLFFNLFSTLLFSQEKEISINSKLKFDKNNYLIKEASINGKNIKYKCKYGNVIIQKINNGKVENVDIRKLY